MPEGSALPRAGAGVRSGTAGLSPPPPAAGARAAAPGWASKAAVTRELLLLPTWLRLASRGPELPRTLAAASAPAAFRVLSSSAPASRGGGAGAALFRRGGPGGWGYKAASPRPAAAQEAVEQAS